MEKNRHQPPPPPGFAPGYGPSHVGYVPTSPPPYADTQAQPSIVIVGPQTFGPESQPMKCPHCQNNISTTVDTSANTKTHLFALLLCLIGCWCCAPCPYCMDSCMVKKHYCPSCRAFLGQSEN